MNVQRTDWVGQVLGGRYEVTAKLGEGGMGTVYRARDRHLDCDVVVKAPRRVLLDDPGFAGRFDREVRALVRLAHPHVVKVTDVGCHDGLPFAVLQYLSGGSLRDRQRAAGGGRRLFAPAELAGWLPAVAAALDFIHEHHFLHRDVKPDNILFDEHGHAYLSDFGVAKALAAGDAPRRRQTVLTGAGMVLGTPGYMAPELILGRPCDRRVDQYALAVVVYELLSGRLPFDGPTPTAVFVQHTTAEPARLEGLLPAGVGAAARAVHRALSKDPRQRFPTCAAFAHAVLEPAPRPVPATATNAATNTAANAATGAWRSTTDPVPEQVPAEATPARREAGKEAGGAVPCPHCGKPSRVPPAFAGKKVRCPACGKAFIPGERSVPSVPRQTLVLVEESTVTPQEPESPLDQEDVLDILEEVVTLEAAVGSPIIPILGGVLIFLLLVSAVAFFIWMWPRVGAPARPTNQPMLLVPAGLEIEGGQQQTLPFQEPTNTGGDRVPESLKAPFTQAEAEKARAEWAKYLKVPERKVLDLGEGVKMEFALIPPGTFLMGSPTTERERGVDERRHEVELTKAFYLAVTETTQAQYKRVRNRIHPTRFKGDSLPVEYVAWPDAAAFCAELRRETGLNVVLPTEAQWEYACRAGTTTAFHFGDELNGTQANCRGVVPYGTATKGPFLERTTPVQSPTYPRNAFGLHDMHGNVWEWCQDGYRTDYELLPKKDPVAEQTSGRRVLRGGAWSYDSKESRSARRNQGGEADRHDVFGFRVAIVLDGPGTADQGTAPSASSLLGPLRIPMNGLGSLQFMDPVSFPKEWKEEGCFARVGSPGRLQYPHVSASSYVFEMELTFGKKGGNLLCRWVDPPKTLWLCTDIQREKLTALLWAMQPDGGSLAMHAGETVQEGSPIRYQLLVDRDRFTLYVNTRVSAWGHSLRQDDLRFRLWSDLQGTDVVIHRCSFREFTKQDAARLR